MVIGAKDSSRHLLQAALVGCGRMGARTEDRVRQSLPPGWLPLNHAEAIQSVPGIELTAMCDVDTASLAECGRRFGVRALYTDYKEMLEDIRPQILSVATRTDVRPEILVSAAEHGVLGVHAEKPLARCVETCRTVLETLESAGVKMTYGVLRRYMDAYRTAKGLIAEGAIGEVAEVLIEHGRTMLLWNHPHSVDLMLFFCGTTRVKDVQADCTIRPESVGTRMVDDDPLVEHAVVRFENGMRGVITCGGGMNTRVHGSRGSLTIGADGRWIEIQQPAASGGNQFSVRKPVTVQAAASGTQRAFIELKQAILHGSCPPPNFEEVQTGLHILLAMVCSSLEGTRRVRLDEVPDDFTVTGRYGRNAA